MESFAEAIKMVFSTLWEVWKEMASAAWAIIPVAFHFFLWAISGIIILPCVFIAGELYPKWQKWGEDF